jgi:putative membrane protein
MKQSNFTSKQIHLFFLVIGLLVFAWSYIDHYDTFGWLALVSLVLIGAVVFISTYNKFTFSTFVYFFGLIWVIILLVGAKYTYSNNPLFDSISEFLNLSRNYYDRVGHFAQGFVPVMVIKEFLYRKNILKPSKGTIFIILCMVLAFSAFHELLEFGIAEITNQPASYILDTQGQNWDTQWDMFLALIGAFTSLFLLGKKHNKYIEIMKQKDSVGE